MIIKSMSRKGPSFGQLLRYFAEADQPGVPLGHNLDADVHDLAAVESELLRNFDYLPQRKNGNVLYHEVLSFSDLDRPHVTPAILEDLTRKYLDLRAPFALAYARAHFQETSCAHVHIMISANNKLSHKRVSLRRAEFATVKRQLERYQKTRYPFLEHSVVFDRSEIKSERIHKTRNERERDRRLKEEGKVEPSRKEQLHDLIAEQITRAHSAKGFRMRLKTLGLQLYCSGEGYGVVDSVGDAGASLAGRKYRLQTLGLDATFRNALDQWEALPQRLIAMEERDLERSEQLWLAQNHRQQYQDILGLHAAELSPLERKRLEQIQAARIARYQSDREPPERSL